MTARKFFHDEASHVRFRQAKIGPEEANELLRMNTANRPLKPKQVAFLARQMSNGHWRRNGDTIRISRDSVLLDGQHRLYAVIESGVEIEFDIIEGLPPEAMDTIDQGGAPRRVSDCLSISGQRNAATVAALAKLVYYMDYRNGWDCAPGTTPSLRLAVEEAREILSENQDMIDAVEFARSRRWPRSPLTATIVAFCRMHIGRVAPIEAVDKFFADVIDGTDLTKGYATWRLRSWIQSGIDSRTKRSQLEVVAACFRSWNWHVEGKKLTKITGQDATVPRPVPAAFDEGEQLVMGSGRRPREIVADVRNAGANVFVRAGDSLVMQGGPGVPADLRIEVRSRQRDIIEFLNAGEALTSR